MTAADILHVAVTVAVIQILCDLIAHWTIFSKESYQKAVDALARSKAKLDKEKAIVDKELEKHQQQQQEAATAETAASSKKGTSSASSNAKKSASSKTHIKLEDKLQKRLKRIEDDYGNALAYVTQRHTMPSMLTSLVFVILLRILGAEHGGKVMAVLPFTPFSLLKRITARGLEFHTAFFQPLSDKVTDIHQACAFVFIYLLCGASVKFYAHKLFGTKPPAGADSFLSLVDSPQGQRMMKAMGVDPEELKVNK